MLGTLNKEEIEEVLKSNVIGRIACSNKEKIYVVPVSYVYDGKYIICHSAEELDDELVKYHAMKKLVDKLQHLRMSETGKPPHLSQSCVHP